MARHAGGIFSNPRGTTSGLVFGAARTPQGKVVTSRQHVIPHNPRTTLQTANRNNWLGAVAAVRALGSTIYLDAFNRAIGQLPGFQSMMSMLKQIKGGDQTVLRTPATANIGTLAPLVGLVYSTISGDHPISITWTGRGVGDQDANDTVGILLITKQLEYQPVMGAAGSDLVNLASSNSATVNGGASRGER